MAITYHANRRGFPGSLVYLNAPGGNPANNGTVIPAVTLVDQTGAAAGGGTSTSPTVTQNQGSGSIATSQASAPTGTSAQIVAARAGRNAVTITNVTGAQQVYVGASGVTASTGQLIPATVGASLTIPTTSAIFAISLTAAQTVSILETF